MRSRATLAEVAELAAQLSSPEQLKLAAQICERLASHPPDKETQRAQLAWLRRCDRIAAQIPGKFDAVRTLRELRDERA